MVREGAPWSHEGAPWSHEGSVVPRGRAVVPRGFRGPGGRDAGARPLVAGCGLKLSLRMAGTRRDASSTTNEQCC